MQKTSIPILLKEDYEVLLNCLRNSCYSSAVDRTNAEDIKAELKKATLVSTVNFPPDVVRLNSKVKIREVRKDKVMELVLVTPDKADIRQRQISVMTPVGTALIGFRQGQKIAWKVPSGKKTFLIIEVINENA